YPTYEVDKFFPKNLEPESSYAIAIKAKREFPDGMYINSEEPKRTMRPLYKNGTQYILVGGESHATGDGISTEQRYNEIYKFAEEQFGVEKGINYRSTNELISSDRLSCIGTKQQDQSNIFVATGFSKWEVTKSNIGAELISDLKIGNDNPYKDLYSL